MILSESLQTPAPSIESTLEFFDAVVHSAGDEGERDDAGDVHFRTEDVHVEAELLAYGLDVLQTFLVVWTRTTDPDLNLVLVQQRCDLSEGADDTLESSGDLFMDMDMSAPVLRYDFASRLG